jgi:hypothetical protein
MFGIISIMKRIGFSFYQCVERAAAESTAKSGR